MDCKSWLIGKILQKFGQYHKKLVQKIWRIVQKTRYVIQVGGRVVEGDSLQNCRVILRVGSNPTPSAKCWRGRAVQAKACKALDVGSIPTANSENFRHSREVCGTVFDRKKVILGVVQLVERRLWEPEAAGPSPATQTNNGTVAQWWSGGVKSLASVVQFHPVPLNY